MERFLADDPKQVTRVPQAQAQDGLDVRPRPRGGESAGREGGEVVECHKGRSETRLPRPSSSCHTSGRGCGADKMLPERQGGGLDVILTSPGFGDANTPCWVCEARVGHVSLRGS